MATSVESLSSRPEVRLLPSVSIRSEREAEIRATASLLAMIRAVSEFGRTIVRHAGGPAGRLSCYTEVPCQLDRGNGLPPEDLRPDGLVQAVRGKSRWKALVEVKVGNTPLDPEQIEKYHRLARQEDADALISISNQPALPDGRPPVPLDGRRLRSVPVFHFSWERLLSEAQMLSRKKAVSDPDQKWMLDEWIRYVDDPTSCIIVPPDLGSKWNDVLRAARTGSLAASTTELTLVAGHWMGFLRKASLRMSAKLGVDVQMRIAKKERDDPDIYLHRLVSEAVDDGTLSGVLKIPDAAGNLLIDVFLHSRSVRYGLTMSAPTEGRQTTRVNWLAKQLRGLDILTDLQITANWSARGLTTTAPAREFIRDSGLLLIDRAGAALNKELHPRSFGIHWTTKLKACRGRSSAPVLEGISEELERFYRQIVENLEPYVPPAPRLVSRKSVESDTRSSVDQKDITSASKRSAEDEARSDGKSNTETAD